MCSPISELSEIINAISTKGLRTRLLCVTPLFQEVAPCNHSTRACSILSFYDVELSLVSSCLQVWHKADYQLMADALCTQLPHTYCFYKYECMTFRIHTSVIPA